MGYISKIRVGGSDYAIGTSLFGTCNTAAGTANKTVTLSDFSALTDGIHISVYFQNENNLSGQTATLNVNSTGAKPIYLYGTTRPTANELSWKAGAVVDFVYHNNAWYLVDNLKTASDLGAIADPSTKTTGQFLKYNGTTWVADNLPGGASPSDATPEMDSGNGSAGTSAAYSRGDHVHPTDTSRQATITANGILKGNGSGTVTAATAGTDYQAPITFDGTYSASTNKAATVSTVTNAINALDGGTIGTGSTTKTITSLSQTNGNVSATFSDIAFPVTSVNGDTGAVTVTEGLEPLIGTTADITPTQVLNAINEGRAVKISHTHATYGVITASYFNYSAAVGAIVSNVIVNFGSSLALSLVGTIQGNTWDVSTILIPSSPDDIGAQPYIYADGILKGDGNGTITAATAGTDYQAPLVSGTNIKTINNESILGSGNISISAGSSDVFIAEYGTSTYAEILAAYEAGKAVFCKKVTTSSYQNTNVVTVLPLAYIGSSDNASSLSRKAIFKNMSGNYPLYQTDITSYTLSGVTGTWTTENIETYTDDPGILSINKSGNHTYLYSNTVNGIVKDDGTGVLSAAVAGTDYQAPLVSGTNIKTINNESILGSGNISISGGTSSIILEGTYTTPSNLYVQKTPTELYNYLGAGTVVYIQGIYDDEDPYFRQRTNSLYRLNSVEIQGEGNNSSYKASITSHPNVIGDNDTTIVYGYASGQTSDTSVAFTLMPIETDSANATNSASKLFLIGATSQTASPDTYSNSDVYATNGVLNAKSFSVDASANIVYNSSAKSIDFTFV